MKSKVKTILAALFLSLTAGAPAMADLHAPGIVLNHDGFEASQTANQHAPIGVMGDHMHKKGEWMMSYRYMHMHMEGNRDGTDRIAPETIVTTVANPFAGPPTLRVVPTEMTMEMHMVGAMYAPSDRLTLMLMGMWSEKEMEHITFAGMAGTAVRGTFTTRSSGWGDTRVSGLVKIHDSESHTLHANIGISLPTGSIDEEDDILTPAGNRPTVRMPYAMQLGTGTYDLLPGLTYSGFHRDWNWGAQYRAEIRLEDENDEGYAWGDRHQLTAWASYQWEPWVSTSVRLTGWTQDEIDGNDPNIRAPVQTANPENFGGDVMEAGLGVNFIIPRGRLVDHRLAFEITVPLYRDLNGPQLETDWAATVGWQYAF